MLTQRQIRNTIMFLIDEKDFEYRFGDSGPKYLMRGPRLNFGVVRLNAGEDFDPHYHNIMEENFYCLEGTVDVYVDTVRHTLTPGKFIHIEPTEVHYLINVSNEPVLCTFALGPYIEVDKVVVEKPLID